MSAAFVQGVLGALTANGVNTDSVAYTNPNAAGSLLVAYIRVFQSSTTSSIEVQDSNGNYWIPGPINAFAGTQTEYIFYCLNSALGTNTVTVTLPGANAVASAQIQMALGEWSGISGVIASSGNATGTGTTATANNITVSQNALILGFAFPTAVSAQPTSIAAPFTLRVNGDSSGRCVIADAVVAPGTYAPAFTYGSSIAWAATSMAFAIGLTPSAPSKGVWKHVGLPVIPNSTDWNSASVPAATQMPTAIYEGNAQLLSGTVFKLWFNGGPNLYYAESLTGLPGSWTRKAAAVITGNTTNGQAFTRVFKFGSTYYAYSPNFPVLGGDGKLYLYTATDGITFSLANGGAAVLSPSGPEIEIVDCFVFQTGATYSMLYSAGQGPYDLNLATSPDLVTWTKSVSNPVLTTNSVSTAFVQQEGSTYYLWCHGGDGVINGSGSGQGFPSSFYKFTSTDLIHWTQAVTPFQNNQTMSRLMIDEGVSSNNGQVANAFLLGVNGQTYFFYTSGFNSFNGTGLLVKSAIADPPQTIAQLSTSTEGNAQYSKNSVAFVQSNQTNDGGIPAISPEAIPYTSPNSTGNLLVLVGRFKISTGIGTVVVSTPTDTQGNTWVVETTYNPQTYEAEIFAYALNCKAGANTVSVGLSGGALYNFEAIVGEYSGVGGFDVAGAVGTGTGAVAGGNVTPLGMNDLVIVWGGTTTATGLSITNGNQLTLRQSSQGNLALQDYLDWPLCGSLTQVNQGLGTSQTWFIQGVAFTAATIQYGPSPAPPSGAFSLKDSRNYGNFPNLSINVNGTLTYTTPSSYSLRYWFDTLFNRTQPLPVDSRAAGAPVASGTYPQNSRAPGTYGPGE